MNLNNDIINKFDKNKLIDDFIFLCYLCGNDFLPNIPSITFKHINKNI